ncbi:ENTH domain [Carpediemonas membranifera]|uniref:ENTH domain n=1 Tax=Carpediemonas membranifera TaxID=201153 RepID=A0A8J6BHL3_9EUKA|nr:ENTH domain [Carpediemonas membranifera]|eukprot:KAG9397647.1 ENTH domain [Carpediemonas membranifera]
MVRFDELASKFTSVINKEMDRAKLPAVTQIATKNISHTLTAFKDTLNSTTDMEKLVREATTNEAWPAAPELLRKIAQLTFHFNQCQLLFPAIWGRMGSQPNKRWRIVYKCLNLIEYLLLNGSTDAIDTIKANLYQINTLSDFQFHDERGEDKGFNVRTKVEKLLALVNSDDLARQRDEILEHRKRFVGIGAGSAVVNRIRSTSNASAYSPPKPAPAKVDDAPVPIEPFPFQPVSQHSVTSPAPAAPAKSREEDLLDLFGASPAQPAAAAQPANEDAFAFLSPTSVSTQPAPAAAPAPASAPKTDPFSEFFTSPSANTAPAKSDDLFGAFEAPKAQPTPNQGATMFDFL